MAKSEFLVTVGINSVKLAVIWRRVKGTQPSDISVQLCNVLHCKNKLNLFLKTIWARSYDLLTKLLKCDLIYV